MQDLEFKLSKLIEILEEPDKYISDVNTVDEIFYHCLYLAPKKIIDYEQVISKDIPRKRNLLGWVCFLFDYDNYPENLNFCVVNHWKTITLNALKITESELEIICGQDIDKQKELLNILMQRLVLKNSDNQQNKTIELTKLEKLRKLRDNIEYIEDENINLNIHDEAFYHASNLHHLGLWDEESLIDKDIERNRDTAGLILYLFDYENYPVTLTEYTSINVIRKAKDILELTENEEKILHSYKTKLVLEQLNYIIIDNVRQHSKTEKGKLPY